MHNNWKIKKVLKRDADTYKQLKAERWSANSRWNSWLAYEIKSSGLVKIIKLHMLKTTYIYKYSMHNTENENHVW